MPGERVRRQVGRLLDEAEAAVAAGDWALVEVRCAAVFALDPANTDARGYQEAALRQAARRELAGSSGLGPLYRRAFVGREQELQQLEQAYDAAQRGQGGLALVVGEPGIGKTTLTEQLATYVTVRGGKTFVGHCYEDGSLSLPYLPFIEVIRGYVLEANPDRLKRAVGSDASEVARIVSEVRERMQVEPAAPSADPGEDRYRLLQAVSSFLKSAATVQPLLLVLEDLHDADRGTLDLLQFLARQLAGARLLVIGTYRDIEVDRQHPLSATLAELRRASNFSRVLLRGLTVDEVQRLIAATAGQEVPWSLAEVVYRQTEGNPLFVQEVVRYLAESGLVQWADGRWQANAGVALRDNIPEGLRDVIGRRLSRLSADCNHMLAVAAVIGREFDLATLVGVSGESEERVVDLLEEAVRVAVIGEQAKVGALRYRFAHAFFRQTLYEELSAARRLRLHQRIARVLEQQYAGRLSEHAAELAEHFTQSTDSADLQKAVAYSRIAAERASSVYAHGEAQRLLEQALEVQEVLDPDDSAAVCDLLLALGDTLLLSSTPLRAAEEIAPRAFALAEALQDGDRAARAAGVALEAMTMYAAGDAPQRPEYRLWAERMSRYAKDGTALRIRADLALRDVAQRQGRTLAVWEHGQRALAQARTLADPALLSLTAGILVLWPGDVRHFAERLRLLDEFADQPEIADAVNAGLALFLRGGSIVCFDWGQRERWQALSRRGLAVMARSRLPRLPAAAMLEAAQLAFVDGDLTGAVDRAYEFQRLTEAIGQAGWGQLTGGQACWRPLLYLGRYEELLERSRSLAHARIVCLAHQGLFAEVHAALRADGVLRRVLNGDEDSYAFVLSPLLEAATLAGDTEVAALLVERLDPLADLASCYMPESCPGRHLGAAAALLGRREQAFGYYHRALAVAERVGFRPEVALIGLQTAELLAEGDAEEQRQAAEQLAFVVPELEAMQMAPALERARALRSAVRPSHRVESPYPDGLTTREVEVLRLLAAGKSNREIAAALVVSLNTVTFHVKGIFNKTGAANRTEASVYAHQHQLVVPVP